MKNQPSSNRSVSGKGLVWMIFVLGSLSAFAPLSIDMYLPAFPRLTEDLHSSASLVQLSLTFCLLGLSIGQLITGPLSDVYGRRRPLVAGLLIYTAASLLCAVSTSIGLLIFLRFVQGLAGAAGIVISRAVVRDMYNGPEMTRFYSLLMLVNGVAPLLAPIAGAQLLRFFPWQGVFITLTAIGALMLAAVAFGLSETLPAERRSPGGLRSTLSTFGRLTGERVFMGYALSQGLVMAAMFAYISGSPFVIQTIYSVSPQGFSLIFSVNALGIIAAGQAVGRLAGKISLPKMLAAGLGIALAGGILLLTAILLGAGLFAVLPSLFLVVSSVGIVSTATFSLAMQDKADSAGSASALIGLLSFIAGGFVAPLVGLGGTTTAVPMALVIAASEIAAVLIYLTMVRGGGRRTLG